MYKLLNLMFKLNSNARLTMYYSVNTIAVVDRADMERKSKTQLWLIDKNPPIFHSIGPHGFTSALPPTTEEVLLQIRGYQNYLQKESRRQSKLQLAVQLVREDLERWWAKTGITVKKSRTIEGILLKLYKSYQKLKSTKKRNTPAEQKHREKFKSILLYSFWIVDPLIERILQEKSIKKGSREEEDWKYLLSVKGKERIGKLGVKDHNLAKTRRRREYENSLLHVDAPSAPAAVGDESEWVTEDEMDAPVGEVFEPLAQQTSETDSYDIPLSNERSHRRRKSRKEDLIPDEVYVIADKYNISNRALMELSVAFTDKNLDDYNISVKTIERRRAKVRLQKASSIKSHQLGSCSEKFYTLHWDSKKIKSMQHTVADKERIAVLLTGTRINNTLANKCSII